MKINIEILDENLLREQVALNEEILFAVTSDMGEKRHFSSSYFIVTQDHIIIWEKDQKESYPITDVDEIKLNYFVSGGSLSLKLEDKWKEVIFFSGAKITTFNQVNKLLNKVMKGESVSEEDLNKDEIRKKCPTCNRLYPDQNIEVCPKCLNRGSLFIRLLKYFTEFKFSVVAMLLLMGLSAIFSIARPFLTGEILINKVLPKDGIYHGKLLEVILLIFVVHSLSVACQIFYGRINAKVTNNMIYNLKKDIFSAMQKLSMSFYTKRQTGTLMTRVNQDSTHVQYFFHDGLPYLIVNTIVIIGILIIMISIKWQLALMVLLPVPLIIMMVFKVFPKFRKLFRKRYQATSRLNNVINDSLTGIRVVKAFGKENAEIERFNKRNKNVSQVELQVGVFSGVVMPLMYFLLTIGGLIVWGLGGYMVVQGDMSFGTIITFTGYLTMLYQPIQFMVEIIQWWSECMNSAKRVFDIIDAKADIVNDVHAKVMPNLKGDILLKDVTFGYETHKPVIKEVNLSIESGKMIGLVGHSGAGKSTLTNLISRLYDVDEGQILIDGVDVKKMDLDSLHSQVGMVLQETFLFSGTVAENIAYAKPEASQLEIILAAKAAKAHEFILELEEGYDTLLGNRGQDLSGGQKQRIAIARTILQNPKILILDEATASMDSETELNIQEALERLTENRTTIAIAHRLSTLRNASKLVVVDKGKIVEEGSHEDLMTLKGKYYDMVEEQKEALKYQGIS